MIPAPDHLFGPFCLVWSEQLLGCTKKWLKMPRPKAPCTLRAQGCGHREQKLTIAKVNHAPPGSSAARLWCRLLSAGVMDAGMMGAGCCLLSAQGAGWPCKPGCRCNTPKPCAPSNLYLCSDRSSNHPSYFSPVTWLSPLFISGFHQPAQF